MRRATSLTAAALHADAHQITLVLGPVESVGSLLVEGVSVQKEDKTAGPKNLTPWRTQSNACTGILLDIQIPHIKRIVFDEFAALFHVFTHERREDLITLYQVL